KEALTMEGVEAVINELKETFDYIVCDSPAGIEHGAYMAMYFADEAVVVTNPEISSVRDSDRILGLLASKTKRVVENKTPVKEYLLLTRYSPERVKNGEMLSVGDIHEILSIPLLGVIPESQSILTSSNQGIPVIMNKNSRAGLAYSDCISRFLGEEIEMRFIDAKKNSIFGKLFRGR
ncbi:MAG: septum site-determining protein MinD, partial [Candidatus Electrothrix sp. AR5]|nr:septum site-determining protein MinD [Candidatus Electrothrix sp. AR5]